MKIRINIFPHGRTACSGPGFSHYRGSTIALRHITLSRTPLDEWSARLWDLYLTKHTHTPHKSKPPLSRRDSNPQSQQASGTFQDHMHLILVHLHSCVISACNFLHNIVYCQNRLYLPLCTSFSHYTESPLKLFSETIWAISHMRFLFSF